MVPAGSRHVALEHALVLAERGDPATLQAIDAGAAVGAPLDALVRFAQWFHGGGGAAPAVGALDGRRLDDEDARLACRLLMPVQRASVLAFDRDALERWCASHAALLQPDDAEGAVALNTARLWVSLMGGGDGLRARASDLYARASSLRMPAASIEAIALRALAALQEGDLAEATKDARHASRMARTEAIAPSELLANVVLARVRRQTGRPYLALRILRSVSQRAPSVWHDWIAWETLLAGGLDSIEAGEDGAGRRGRAVPALEDVLSAAAAGDREAFGKARAAVATATAAFAAVAREAALLADALDPSAAPGPDLEPWATGATAVVPMGLDGVCGSAAPAREGLEPVTAHVCALPGERGRRVLSAGLALAPARAMEPPRANLRGNYRTDTGLAVLSLAGPDGLDRAELFQRVYQMRFSTNTHTGVLDTLFYRMRLRLEGMGTVARDGERVTLALTSPLVVSDPRCVEATATRLLRRLAARGTLGTEQMAAELGLTARAVQLALQELVDEGTCEARREGRRIVYQLEDTTFSEPTSLPGR